jgi:SAM-dependent methyltransferase
MGSGNNNLYGREFYSGIRDGSKASAREVAAIVRDLVPCDSVIDVGCGTGSWLSAFQESGTQDILGVDGDYVDCEMLMIPPEHFVAHDLTKPLRLDRKFDLAVSVEVAEHLPESSAAGFVESLTRLAPVVLFSAAIPNQEGTHHVNEQWCDYWVELFAEKNFVVIDCLRSAIWQNENVEWWYKQNLLVFVEKDSLGKYPELQKVYAENAVPPRLVHPELLMHHVSRSKGKLVRSALKLQRLIEPLIRRNG